MCKVGVGVMSQY